MGCLSCCSCFVEYVVVLETTLGSRVLKLSKPSKMLLKRVKREVKEGRGMLKTLLFCLRDDVVDLSSFLPDVAQRF